MKDISKEIFKLEEKFVDREMFYKYKYFGYEMPSKMLAKLIKSNKEDNIKLVALVKNRLRENIKNTPDGQVKSELEKIGYFLRLINN